MSEIILSRDEQVHLEMISDLNKPRGDGLKVGLSTRLHPDQIEQMKPLYLGGKMDMFLSCGRKWGKTELICYTLWKHALDNPGSACYYVAPEGSHARELVWENNRLQQFLGTDSSKYIKGVKNQSMVLKFRNGSYIRCIGSENYGVANGLTPGFAVYDEFKLFNPRWHVEFAPNRAAKAAPLIIIGTKPRAGNRNQDQYNDILKSMRGDVDCYVADRTTFDNPINHLPAQKKIIDKEIRQLRERGEEDVVQLEYFSKFVPGGKAAVFPMLRSEKHVFPHADLMEEVSRDATRLEWAWIADPGNMTCFGMLFAALNRYTGTLYILSEIYETDQMSTSTGVITPKGKAICNRLFPHSDIQDEWQLRCDDQAAWYMTEAMATQGLYFSPADKFKGTKEEGISLIKDQLLHCKVKISSDCKHLFDEMEKYAKDGTGKIPKKNDHLIDCFRYLNIAINYDFKTIHETVGRVDPIREGRFRGRYKEDDPEDWTDQMYDDFDLDMD